MDDQTSYGTLTFALVLVAVVGMAGWSGWRRLGLRGRPSGPAMPPPVAGTGAPAA